LRRRRTSQQATKESTMSRLETIATRQRRSRTRDLMFACFVALAAAIGASSVGAAVQAASAIAQQ
jgi:beta-lactamase regulating signal transducer with metallopeptidase domain